MIGRTLGHFRVTAKLGEGGMGAVYRAKDLRLGREVAVKVLPEAFAADPQRMARFEREARVLASLSHPRIAGVHEVGQEGELRFLVMELAPGETLADRIARGPLPVREALELAAQIAEALSAAHARGVVHRDLKPSNVQVGPGGEVGEVKVLDFGLAKAVASESLDSPADGTRSPTLPYQATRAGTLLGTACYMSPEQARGKPVDQRADLWALGCVLYEMLAGRRAFPGETVSDMLAAVLEREPDWGSLPQGTPPLARSVLRRCLQKDLAQRLRDAADARLLLLEALRDPEPAPGSAAAPPAATRPGRRRWLLLAAAVLAAAALGVVAGLAFRSETRALRPVVERYQLQPPHGVVVAGAAASMLAISPDGRWVAFRGFRPDRSRSAQLYLRAIAELEARPVPGTEDAWNPFFSPDSEWLGYWADGKLRRVRLSGNEPQEICAVGQILRGSSWGEDGTIVFSERDRGLIRVPAGGGEPQQITDPKTAETGENDIWPSHLPGGRGVLFTRRAGLTSFSRWKIALVTASGEVRTLLTGGVSPRFVAPGRLVYQRGGILYATSFDLDRLEVADDAQPILERVYDHLGSRFTGYDVSADGALVFLPAAPQSEETELVRIDREGAVANLVPDRRRFDDAPSFSPDGSRFSVVIETRTGEWDLWIHDLPRGSWTRLTDDGEARTSLWSRDGRWILFSWVRSGSPKLARVPADGSSPPEQLTSGPEWEWAGSISPDGRTAIFVRDNATTLSDLFTISLDASPPREETFLATTALEAFPDFSPDGRWVAYGSSESGSMEVWVRRYPEREPSFRVSVAGGSIPRWRPDGREILYRAGKGIWAVAVQTEPTFSAGEPRLLFEADFLVDDPWTNRFHVSPDGLHIDLVRYAAEAPERQLVYVPNWAAEVTQILAQRGG
ncbi:MAG TPA: protein kinase [Thermoanaerobaculia bacterium]|nr:protein kinase [Thermoanaerobaculia bacterium]